MSNFTPASYLSQEHLQMLKASAINDEVLRARGYRTIQSVEELRQLEREASV